MKRRYLAEFIGTFGIVFAPVALSATGKLAGGDGTLTSAAWVSGLSVLAMIYAFGHISAAHFNPAVTIGFAVMGRFPWRFVAAYIAVQLAGGVAAALIVGLLFGTGSGVHVPSVSPVPAFFTEVLLSFLLMLIIASVATDKRVNGAVPGLAIGLIVVVDVLIGGPVTGGSMNPARSFGPALVSGNLNALLSLWIYLFAPVVGAVCAARLYEALRGDAHHGQGAPNDLAVALASVATARATE